MQPPQASRQSIALAILMGVFLLANLVAGLLSDLGSPSPTPLPALEPTTNRPVQLNRPSPTPAWNLLSIPDQAMVIGETRQLRIETDSATPDGLYVHIRSNRIAVAEVRYTPGQTQFELKANSSGTAQILVEAGDLHGQRRQFSFAVHVAEPARPTP